MVFCARTEVAAAAAGSVSEVRARGRSNGHHLSISVCLSVRLSVSCNQRQILCAAPTIAIATAILSSSLFSYPLLSSALCIHMYLAPDTMDSEMAPLVDGDTALDRKTADDSGNGRRSERTREGE